MVEAGAVALARAASTTQKGRFSPSRNRVTPNTTSEAAQASAMVTQTTFQPFLRRVSSLKNSPALKAMKQRARSARKSVFSIMGWGIRFRQQGPIRMPAVR